MIFGRSDAWSTSHLSQQTSQPAYYIVDCRISIPQVKAQYFVLRLLLPLEKLPGLGVRLLMIITNALFFKSNEGAGINKIPQSSGHFFVPIITLNQIPMRQLL